MEETVINKQGLIDGANIKCRQIYDVNGGHNYKLISQSRNKNMIVECFYIEETGVINSSDWRVLLTQKLWDIREIVKISILNDKNKTLKTYQLYFSNAHYPRNGIVMISRTGNTKKDIKIGSEDYAEFCKIFDYINTHFDVFTVKFVDEAKNMIEYDMQYQNTPNVIAETIAKLEKKQSTVSTVVG